MHFFTTLLTMVLLAYCVRVRKMPTLRQIVAYTLFVNAVAAFWAGFHQAVREDTLGRYGHVVVGTVSDRNSTTGEAGSKTIGRRSPAFIITIEGNEFYDQIQRLIATGSTNAWAVTYSYPCGGAHPCWSRSFISHDLWAQTKPGQPVTVRYANGWNGGVRLEDETQWAAAIARMAIGASLASLAVLVWGTKKSFIRTRRMTTLAVVTGVEPVAYRGASRWRVRFSYRDRDGNPHEASDEFAAGNWKAGDTGLAVYERENPGAAGLQRA